MALTLLLAATVGIPLLTACDSSSDKDPVAEHFYDVAVTFHWTAVGDDALDGRANRYDLRYSLDSAAFLQNWNQAMTVRGLPTPAAAGSPETFEAVLRLELGRTYFFAIRAGDEAGNWSPPSNIIAYTPSDSTATRAAIDFNAGTN